jgi:hypothetical protein
MYSCLNIENTSTEILQVIKTSNQRHGLKCTHPNAEMQEIWKKGCKTPPKVKNLIVKDTKNTEVDERLCKDLRQMTKEFKEVLFKHLNELKENTSK